MGKRGEGSRRGTGNPCSLVAAPALCLVDSPPSRRPHVLFHLVLHRCVNSRSENESRQECRLCTSHLYPFAVLASPHSPTTLCVCVSLSLSLSLFPSLSPLFFSSFLPSHAQFRPDPPRNDDRFLPVIKSVYVVYYPPICPGYFSPQKRSPRLVPFSLARPFRPSIEQAYCLRLAPFSSSPALHHPLPPSLFPFCLRPRSDCLGRALPLRSLEPDPSLTLRPARYSLARPTTQPATSSHAGARTLSS